MSWTFRRAEGGRFVDGAFSAEQRCSLGVDQTTGTHYLSIPVSNRLVDYEEYYRLSAEEYDGFLADPARAYAFAERCRQRELDGLLIIPAGADRGVPR
jgi:hypothetical protein